MNNYDLIVDDAGIEEAEKFFDYTSEITQNKIDKVLDILANTRKDAVISGDVAEALDEYIEKLSEMRTCVRQYGIEAKNLLDSYKTKIDEVDKKLY